MLNTVLRVLLVLWILGFLLVSCAPLYTDGAIGFFGLVGGLILLVPWLVGVVLLVIGIWLTNPRRYELPRDPRDPRDPRRPR